jgi:hypothetical protein
MLPATGGCVLGADCADGTVSLGAFEGGLELGGGCIHLLCLRLLATATGASLPAGRRGDVGLLIGQGGQDHFLAFLNVSKWTSEPILLHDYSSLRLLRSPKHV